MNNHWKPTTITENRLITCWDSHSQLEGVWRVLLILCMDLLTGRKGRPLPVLAMLMMFYDDVSLQISPFIISRPGWVTLGPAQADSLQHNEELTDIWLNYTLSFPSRPSSTLSIVQEQVLAGRRISWPNQVYYFSAADLNLVKVRQGLGRSYSRITRHDGVLLQISPVTPSTLPEGADQLQEDRDRGVRSSGLPANYWSQIGRGFWGGQHSNLQEHSRADERGWGWDSGEGRWREPHHLSPVVSDSLIQGL